MIRPCMFNVSISCQKAGNLVVEWGETEKHFDEPTFGEGKSVISSAKLSREDSKF